MKIEEILALVPDYRSFLSVDEMDLCIGRLAALYPQTIHSSVAGYSRKGHPIQCMRLGRGEKNALCFACPHPNEPIGAMTLLTLAEIFCKMPELLEETGFTWYLIPCIDPDGTRLNEGWFKGPFTLRHYVRHFYRPPGSKQVEWTFPIDLPGWQFDSPLPETRILMSLINELRPSYMFSLHNSAYGGAYWYLSKGDPGFCARLEDAARRQNIPLHLGEPEALYITKYSDAVFSMMSITAYVEYTLKTAGQLPETATSCGGCSADYIRGVCDCLTMLAEVPYFYDCRIEDCSDSEMTHREAIRESVRLESANYEYLEGYWAQIHPLFSADNPFYEYVDTCVDARQISEESRLVTAEGDFGSRPAKVSEVFDNLYGMRISECLNFGLAIRACSFELARAGARSPAETELLTRCRKAFEEKLDQMCAWLARNASIEVIPIRRLVSIQLESALRAAEHLRHTPTEKE